MPDRPRVGPARRCECAGAWRRRERHCREGGSGAPGQLQEGLCSGPADVKPGSTGSEPPRACDPGDLPCPPGPVLSLPWSTLTTDHCQPPEPLPVPIPSEGWEGGVRGGRGLLAAGCERGRGGCLYKGTACARQVVSSPLTHFSAPHPAPLNHGSRGAGSKEAQQPDHQLLPPPHTNLGHKAPSPNSARLW